MKTKSEFEFRPDPYEQYFRKAEEAIRGMEADLRQAKAEAEKQRAQAKTAGARYHYGTQAQQAANTREQYSDDSQPAVTFHYVDEYGRQLVPDYTTRKVFPTGICEMYIPDLPGYQFDEALLHLDDMADRLDINPDKYKDNNGFFYTYILTGGCHRDVYVHYKKVEVPEENPSFWARLKNGYYSDVVRGIACDVLVALAVFMYVTNPSWWMNQLWEKYHAESAAIQEIDPDYDDTTQEIIPIDDGVIVDDAHTITVTIDNNHQTSADEGPINNPMDDPVYNGNASIAGGVNDDSGTGWSNPMNGPVRPGVPERPQPDPPAR